MTVSAPEWLKASCHPPLDTKDCTLHVLKSGDREQTFEWKNKHWNTPGTGWGTKWSAMTALGWRYVRSVGENVEDKCVDCGSAGNCKPGCPSRL